MEFNDIITFEGGMNTDDTPQSMPKGDYRNFSYCRLGYNAGNAYAVTTSDGTLVIPNPDIEIQDQIIGATPWQKTNSIVYFVFKASLVHEIWVYNIDDQTHTVAVQSGELNFSRDWPIFHANVIDDILKWTDGRWDNQMYDADGNRLFNPPYQINIQKALDGDYTAITLQTIDAIKWPMDPPLVSYFTDATRNDNKLRNKLFKFIIQPIYENGETGVWSMYSNLDLPEQSEFVSGTNWVFPNNSNGIRIQFNTGPEIIRKFNIAVQQFDKDNLGATPPFSIFLQLDKDQDVIPSNTIYSVDYYGGVSTVPAVDVFKNYDRLPIVADCQEYLPTNQLTYVNFREGYDKPTEEPFILDVGVGYDLNEIFWNPTGSPNLFEVEYNFSLFRFSNYLVSTAAPSFDATLVFAFSEGMVVSYADSSNNLISYAVTKQDIDTAQALFPSIYAANASVMQAIGDSFADQIGVPPGFVASGPSPGQIRYDATLPASVPLYNVPVKISKQTLASPSLKAGATHEFGIVYGDRAYRDSTVYTVDSMNLFVPWFWDINRSGLSNTENPFTITPNFTINHIPPVWATKYWIVAKPATEISSFGQYTTNANPVQPDGGYYISSITIDQNTNNRYKIAIDKYYVTQNLGAVIRHEIKVGDKMRFIRRRPGGSGPVGIPYLPYLELDVIGYEASGEGVDGRQVVYTNLFDTSLLQSEIDGFLFGPLLEIYTPRPAVDDTGNLFVSTWKDITEAIEIRNPHTVDRAHGSPVAYYIQVGQAASYFFYLPGDQTNLLNSVWTTTIFNNDGTSSFASTIVIDVRYNQSTNITVMVLQGITPTGDIAYVTFNYDDQIVSNLASSSPAEFPLNYGDVYVRQRNYQTGTVGLGAVNYYFIEDPHYSDYWSSDIHNDGRIRIEDQNARMTHRQATAIHSDSFIVGTQINGLSSFALDNTNIEDMNPVFGPVVRAYMSGREGKTLKCLQPKKENSLYIQYYPNEVGSDSTVRVSNKTFASWFDYKSLLGCSDPGATAILPDGSTIYFDNNTGVFVYTGANGQIVVSEIDKDTQKDYKFRTKTKALAAAYNASSNPVVRTYVNESVGEVGFAFRFDSPISGIAFSLFNPPADSREGWSIRTINGDYTSLYGQFVIIVHENGNVYSGTVTSISIPPVGPPFPVLYLDTGGPLAIDFDVPAYYYTTSGMNYDHVVFDYVNKRWRSTYDYNFQQFCNLGQTLVGWGVDNELYLHNQPNQWNFHGDAFVQQVSFVSNETPLSLKRYQDITLVSDDLFSIEAQSEPNRSYPLGMKTTMPTNLISTYEGYGKVNNRKNLYDPKFFIDSNGSVTSYAPPLNLINGWTLSGDQTGLLNTPPIPPDTITIIQTDGNIYTGQVDTAVYDAGLDVTTITLVGVAPGTFGVNGNWYFSERALCNGQDIRANALTHTLEYNPAVNNTGSILVSVGIKGVLS